MLRGDLCLGLKGIVDDEGDGGNGTVFCTWNSGATIFFSQSLFARTLPHVLDTYHIPAKVLEAYLLWESWETEGGITWILSYIYIF